MATINLQFPLKKSAQGAFATNEDTLDAIADDLRILLLSNYGERPILYDFGANLRSVIFESQGESLRQRTSDLIQAAVEKWMPYVRLVRIDVEDFTINSTLLDNEIHVELEFSVGDIDITKVLSQRIRG